MCGICGMLLSDRSRDIDTETLRRMCSVIAHRGPDDEGVFVDRSVGLGIRRLSIIDPEGGRQPILNEDGSVALVFNGEIYNFAELRRELVERGHTFSTRADTEVVVHGYEEFGHEVVHRLRGMFAFALWDARSQALLLAVDRFGIKPLYWADGPSGIVFGSELSSLLVSRLVQRELDMQSLSEYFTLGYVPAPRSILAGVQKLLPGTHLSWTAGSGPELRTYWRPPIAELASKHDPGELQERLLHSLRDAVRSHLVSDVPLGAFLSGGIDSSVIVALMAEFSSYPVRTFSIGFGDAEHDELAKARKVARRFGTDHHELVVEPESVEILPRLVSHFGEPFADSSALPTYHVSSLAARSVKVALSGDGGDELFVGYTTFRGVELARALQALPEPARRALARVAQHPPSFPWPAWSDRASRWSKQALDSLTHPADAYRSKIALVPAEDVAQLLSRELRHDLQTRDPFRSVNAVLDAHRNGSHPLERFLRVNLEVSLPSDMLVKVDRMSMASSLEVRVPMLDHLLAEFVLAIPVRNRFPRWRLKGLLRDSVRGLLPDEIVRQRKHGFTVPLARWFRDDVTAFAHEVLLDGASARRGFFDLTSLERVLTDHASGRRNAGALIWSLLMFELWCQDVLV